MDRIREHFESHASSYYSRATNEHEDRVWAIRKPIFERMVKSLGPGNVDILDVGGGAGYQADLLLDHFPNITVSVVDISQSLLDMNRPHERKTLIRDDFRNVLGGTKQQYGIINFDVILHHILSQDSYSNSRAQQHSALETASNALVRGGYINIRELAYRSFGFLPRHACHRLLWYITTRRFPAAIRDRLHTLGMKSQGGGVCFFHQKDLPTALGKLGLEIESNQLKQFARINWKYRVMLAANCMDQYLVAKKTA